MLSNDANSLKKKLENGELNGHERQMLLEAMKAWLPQQKIQRIGKGGIIEDAYELDIKGLSDDELDAELVKAVAASTMAGEIKSRAEHEAELIRSKAEKEKHDRVQRANQKADDTFRKVERKVNEKRRKAIMEANADYEKSIIKVPEIYARADNEIESLKKSRRGV